jgi:hypothetical protein
MISQVVFLVGALLLLLLMGYVMWGGVGRSRPAMGRGFAVLALAASGYVGNELFDLLT